MSEESKKKPSLRFKEKEKEVVYNVGVWYLYCTKNNDFYLFDKSGEHVIEFCEKSSGWFRTFNKGEELVHWTTGITKEQKMEGKEGVIDLIMKEINDGKRDINVIEETVQSVFGNVNVKVDIEKDSIIIKRKIEWSICLPIKWDGEREITFKDMNIFNRINVDDIISCMLRSEEIKKKKEEEEERKKRAEEEALKEKYKSLIGGPPNEEACRAFSEGERCRVYSFGIWLITIAEGGDDLVFVNEGATHVLEIVFSSNGWFRTRGPDGDHIHWSSGSVNHQGLGTNSEILFTQESLMDGLKNRLRPGIEYSKGGWSISLREDGVHTTHHGENEIFINFGETTGTFRGDKMPF